MDWIKWYIECGWLWMIWGLQVAFNYSVAYGPAVVSMAGMIFDFWLFLNMNIGTRIIRKGEDQWNSIS